LGLAPGPAAPTGERTQDRRSVSLPLFVAFGIVATGGPLALVALYVPGAVSASRSLGLVGVLAAGLFVVPVSIWYRYSREVASSGGLYSFVEAAAGRPFALLQAGVWIISYFLYLPYTVAYVVYDLLPVVFPGIGGLRPVLEILLPLAVVGLALLPIRTALLAVGGLALLQLALLTALFAVGASHVGLAGGSFAARGAASTLAAGAANASLLYVCTSLPLYLGGEVVGGSVTVRRGLVAGFGISALFVVVGALVWARAGTALLASPIPGAALARAATGHGFSVLVGLGVAASVAGVIVAEYFALTRLLHAVTGRTIRQATGLVAAGFLVSSLLSLIDPRAFYDDLLKPSLVALWISQLLVFVVYPRFARLRRQLVPPALVLAAGASALMGYGLYQALHTATS
jgi:amino acid transporter